MKVKIIDRSPVRVAYLRHVGPYGQPLSWQEVVYPWLATNDLLDQPPTIPGGRYAVTEFRGTAMEIGETWSALLRDWLPSSGMQLDSRPCFEYYPTDRKYDAGSGAFGCDIVIPVVPL